jgi:hypothetical protein
MQEILPELDQRRESLTVMRHPEAGMFGVRLPYHAQTAELNVATRRFRRRR